MLCFNSIWILRRVNGSADKEGFLDAWRLIASNVTDALASTFYVRSFPRLADYNHGLQRAVE